MAETKFKTGDKVVFIESPFPNPKIPEGVFTLGKLLGNFKEEPSQNYWDIPFKKGSITVVEKWIKKAEDNE
jgi:hypothetical protein